MKSFFYGLIIVLGAQGLFAQDSGEYEALQTATFRYIEFINHIGGDSDFDSNKSLICAPDCKKIFNGELQTKNREELVAQLLSIREKNRWMIKPVDILISPQNHAAVLRTITPIEDTGTFTAIVILRYSPDLQVTEINEVFNEFKGLEHEVPKIR